VRQQNVQHEQLLPLQTSSEMPKEAILVKMVAKVAKINMLVTEKQSYT
jgi:hypothetical protein